MIASGKLPEALDEFFAGDAALQEDTAKLRGHAVAMPMILGHRAARHAAARGERSSPWNMHLPLATSTAAFSRLIWSRQ
jgi:hypothetical protein